MNDNPWPTVSDRLNKHVRMDPSLANKLKELSQHQAADDKVAFAIEAGRCYGLQEQYYQMILRKQLNREKLQVQGMW